MTEKLDAETVREWGERYSNWGRWGEDDEHGALNFITRSQLQRCHREMQRSGTRIGSNRKVSTGKGRELVLKLFNEGALNDPTTLERLLDGQLLFRTKDSFRNGNHHARLSHPLAEGQLLVSAPPGNN